MERTIVIKLLGRSIGFNVFLDKVTMLRKSRSSFQLINLESNFYLVRFHDKSNFECLLKAIGQLVGPVVRIDVNTMLEKRGQFAHLVVCVDLKRPLISKIRIEERLQTVEYEGLSNVYFRCGVYGSSSKLCQGTKMIPKEDESNKRVPEVVQLDVQNLVEEEKFYPWMLVEHRQ
ncbi:hypothetical protein PVK06_030311 [Gossypium arboreum]|uniref:Uncharacterized protein n=1 Tax=Gossypium arboreum TaxID=29729 RepID=A0ABR0NMZ3_GOSAR|nr:hypothetical protein PVK06_030311 [Gossypium arboreum]